jgi:hypothetical protein
MKLYNLLNDIILEETTLLTEGVNKSEIYDALKKHNRIKILYQGEYESRPEVRYIDVYAYGVSTGGNEVIRVYQAFGKTTTDIGWKLMRLDRITNWQPTNYRFSEKALDNDPTIPKRNISGDNSMATVYAVARFEKSTPVQNNKVNTTQNKQPSYNNVMNNNKETPTKSNY